MKQRIRTYSPKTDCGYKSRYNQHKMQYNPTSGWIICRNCGWRNPNDQ